MLTNPESRRGLRAILMAVSVMAILYFVWTWAPLLDEPGLLKVVLSLIVLLGIDKVGYVMENGLRAFKVSVGKDGASVEATGEDK